MSESDYNTIGWRERADAYRDMVRVWRSTPETLRDFCEETSSLVEALQKHPVWEKVDALRRTLGVTDRYDELPAHMDGEDLAVYASDTEKCHCELVAEIAKLQTLASELDEVAEHAKWAAKKGRRP